MIYLTCLFPNKLHCQAAIIQTFVLVILPDLLTDRSSGKARDKNVDRWKIHLLEIAVWIFLCCFGVFSVQLAAIRALLKDMVCPCKNLLKKDGTV